MTMRKFFVFLCAVLATVSLVADDLPFWGEDNGAGTNVLVTAAGYSSSAKQVAVRTIDIADSNSIGFISYPRSLCISIR